jgi:protein-tyrosine phosphatase
VTDPAQPSIGENPTDRVHAIDGTFNFRDLGGGLTADGRRVRTGRLFRSAALDTVTDDGLDALDELGIRTILDIRSRSEVERSGRVTTEGRSARWVHIASKIGPPAADNPLRAQMLAKIDPMPFMYQMMMSEGANLFGPALQTIADADNQPVVFHCTSGKDRTGILAVLVYLIIGVPLEAALVDYEFTSVEQTTVRDEMKARYPELASLSDELLNRMAGVDRAWVVNGLERVGLTTQPDAWFDSVGVDSTVRQSLRDQLVA